MNYDIPTRFLVTMKVEIDLISMPLNNNVSRHTHINEWKEASIKVKTIKNVEIIR
jgi:hypothetical protein